MQSKVNLSIKYDKFTKYLGVNNRQKWIKWNLERREFFVLETFT